HHVDGSRIRQSCLRWRLAAAAAPSGQGRPPHRQRKRRTAAPHQGGGMMNLAIYSAQVLLVVAAATVSLALFRLAMPRARLTYWRVVVLICLLLPGLPGRRAPSVVQRGDVTSSVLVTDGEPAGMRAPALATAVVESLPWIAVIGAAARGAWLAIGLVRLRRLRRPGGRAILDESLTALHRDLAPAAELRWHVRLTQPGTFGWGHHVE